MTNESAVQLHLSESVYESVVVVVVMKLRILLYVVNPIYGQ